MFSEPHEAEDSLSISQVLHFPLIFCNLPNLQKLGLKLYTVHILPDEIFSPLQNLISLRIYLDILEVIPASLKTLAKVQTIQFDTKVLYKDINNDLQAVQSYFQSLPVEENSAQTIVDL